MWLVLTLLHSRMSYKSLYCYFSSLGWSHCCPSYWSFAWWCKQAQERLVCCLLMIICAQVCPFVLWHKKNKSYGNMPSILKPCTVCYCSALIYADGGLLIGANSSLNLNGFEQYTILVCVYVHLYQLLTIVYILGNCL